MHLPGLTSPFYLGIEHVITHWLSNTCSALPPGSQNLGYVEIEAASFDYSRDQNKIENKIPVVSVSDRGKRMGNYCTNSGIYTVDYENKRR